MPAVKESHQLQLEHIRVGLPGHVVVKYGIDSQSYENRPAVIDVGLGGMFVPSEQPPSAATLKATKLVIRWINPPFLEGEFVAEAELVERRENGIRIRFVDSPVRLKEWIRALDEAGRLPPTEKTDYIELAVKASEKYTRAAVISAIGLFLGALGVLVQLAFGNRWSPVPESLLSIMVASIGVFGYVRWRAGKIEAQAINSQRSSS